MYRRRRFGGPRHARRPAIVEQSRTATKRQRCSGCHSFIAAGETCTRFMLRKEHRRPCGSCGNEPKRSRWYHEACKPTDTAAIEKAMGYNPAASTYDIPPPSPRGNATAPPPKPPSFEDLALESIVKLEATLVARVRERKIAMTPDLEASFKRFQGIKARVLRPGTPAEGEVATNLALQQLVKLVFQA